MNKCEEWFSRKEQLQNHEKYVHLQIKDFQCNVCNKSFMQKLNLKEHVKYIHSKVNAINVPNAIRHFHGKVVS